MKESAVPATLDTNIAVYAVTEGHQAAIAGAVLNGCEFLSVQVLNEYANVGIRKLRRDWSMVALDLDRLRRSVSRIIPIDDAAHVNAVRIAARYRLSFYDALMLAVALSGGAASFYSEDMQHDLIIDGTLRIVDPFHPEVLAIRAGSRWSRRQEKEAT